MTRRLGLIAGWLSATVIAVLISMTAVSLVGASVIEQPSNAFVTTTTLMPQGTVETTPASPVSTVPSTAPAPSDPTLTTSTTLPATTSTTEVETTTTTDGAGSTTTTAPSTTTTTTTPSTTTTTTPETTGPFTFPVDGGTVTVRCHADEISLSGAVPETGYGVEVEKSGPEEVRVTFFIDEDDEVEIRIECEDGVPDVEIEF